MNREDSATTQSWTGERAAFRNEHSVEDATILNGRDEVGRQGRFNPDAAIAQKIGNMPARQSAFMTDKQYVAALGMDGNGPGGATGRGQTGNGDGKGGPGGNDPGRVDEARPENIPPKHMRQQFGYDPKEIVGLDPSRFREPTVSLEQFREQKAKEAEDKRKELSQEQGQQPQERVRGRDRGLEL